VNSGTGRTPHPVESAIRRILDAGDLVFAGIAIFMLAAMVLSISVDAAGRYLFSSPLRGNYEFTSLFGMVALTFMAMPRTYSTGGHIRLEVFGPYLRRVPWNISERLNIAVGIAAFGLLAWVTGEEAIHKVAARETTLGSVQFPTYLSYLWIPLGSGWLFLRLCFEMFHPSEKPPAEPLE
jgi:TRAP-type C4-dicarboxylate transport system permease small subunit